jgi:hypothetical protein
MYSFMMEPYSEPIPGYDNRDMGTKIKSFLIPRCEDSDLVRDYIIILESARVSHICSKKCWSWRRTIPSGASLSQRIYGWPYSRTFWKGNDRASQVARSSIATEHTQAVE